MTTTQGRKVKEEERMEGSAQMRLLVWRKKNTMKARRQEGSRGGSILNPQLYKAVGTLTSRWRTFWSYSYFGPEAYGASSQPG
jgi:hypothetical protein